MPKITADGPSFAEGHAPGDGEEHVHPTVAAGTPEGPAETPEPVEGASVPEESPVPAQPPSAPPRRMPPEPPGE